MIKDISDLVKAGESTEFLHQQINQLLEQKSVNQESPKDGSPLAKVLATQAILKKRVCEPIEFSKPMVLLAGQPILFPHTINVIQGKAGVHKSRLAEIFASLLLAKGEYQGDYLHFERTDNTPVQVCYVDTERNLKDQFPFAIQQIKEKAGFSIREDLDQLTFISLLEIGRTERFNTLGAYLDYLRANTEGHLVVILDVITDCVQDFNRADYSLELTDLMNQAINQYNITFLAVIHENPGMGQKARGHLGTELNNKASTVVQVGMTKDQPDGEVPLVKISFLKCRSSAQPSPLFAKYSQEARGLVLASESEILSNQKVVPQKAPPQAVRIALCELLHNQKMKKADLLAQLTEMFECSKRTIEDRLKEIWETKQTIWDGKNHGYQLHKSKEGNQIWYQLAPTEEVE